MSHKEHSHRDNFELLMYKVVQRCGPIFIILGISLMVLCAITTARLVLPRAAEPGSISFYILHLFFSVVSFGAIFNYIAVASFRGPVVDAGETKRIADQQKALAPATANYLLEKPGRYCAQCERYKAPREYHCKFCQSCIPKMDHHCPWINNCVQAENQRYFVLMLLYLMVACGFIMMLLGFVYVGQESQHNIITHQKTDNGDDFIHSSPIRLLCVLCAPTFFLIVFMFGMNIVHVLKNETPIESFLVEDMKQAMQRNLLPFRNPYDLGRWLNILAVFETKGDPIVRELRRGARFSKILVCLWLMLPTLRPSVCNGVHYTVFYDIVYSV
uniref:Palmitoyltransferase n=1 Tax=Trypanosoma congolense (strain IL3000) TaxID=1068625 RepID=G0UV81_TRYCI|nr:conserved hypothetical protein [Trypanosoma congolense IL3000]